MAAHSAWNGTHRLATGELRYVGELLRTRLADDPSGRSGNRLAERVRTTARRFRERPHGASSRSSRTAARPPLARDVTTAQ